MVHCLPIRVSNLQRDCEGKEHSTKSLFDKDHWWVYRVSSLWFQRENLQHIMAAYLPMRGWSGDFIYGYLRISYCHIAVDLMHFKIKGRGRPRCKPSFTQGRTTYCAGSLPEWITGRCSTSVLRLISQPAYFKSSPAEDTLQLLTQQKTPLEL